ncbi:hypothetical protein D3C81_1026310 [compost metagenome]
MRQQVVKRTALEPGQRGDVEELEALTELFAVGLERLPHGWVLGVVIDHQHFVVRIVQRGQGVERLFDHLWRFVVARYMHRDLGPVGAVALHRQKLPAAFVSPGRLGQLVRLGQ